MDAVKTTLVLFDIDGTLIQSGRAGVRGMNAAFRRLYGRDSALDRVPIAGRTDRAIVADALQMIGIEPSDEEIGRLHDAYVSDLRIEIGRPVALPSGVLPGVTELLSALERVPHVAVGLLTGNFAAGAAIKLGHFGLWKHFGFGAYGDVHADRRALVPVALGEAARAGCVPTSRDRVTVIGDTPLDVDCARAHGVRALGVATGPFSEADLAAAGAHLSVPTMADTRAIVRWLVDGVEGSVEDRA